MSNRPRLTSLTTLFLQAMLYFCPAGVPSLSAGDIGRISARSIIIITETKAGTLLEDMLEKIFFIYSQ